MSCLLTYVSSITGDCTNSSLGSFSIDIAGSAPDYTIQWVSPAYGNIFLGPGVTNYTINSLPAGNYSFNILDSCSPQTSLPVSIVISSGTCVSITNIEDTLCGLNNGSLTASTANFYGNDNFYLYESTLGYITSGSSYTNTYSFNNNLAPGTYYVIATDGGGCTGKSETCIIKSSTTLDFGFYVVDDAGCAVDSGKVYVTGATGQSPFTYLWTFNGSTDSYITGLTSGTYSVTVTDASGCSTTKSAQVNVVPIIGLGSVTTTNPSCFSSNGSATVTVTGGTAPYYFSGSNGVTNITFNTSYTFENLASGVFTFQVTDAGLCTFTSNVSLLPPGGFSIVDIQVNNSQCNNFSGSLNPIQLYGGSGNYTYSLQYPDGHIVSQSTTSQSWQFLGLSGGTYHLTITDGVCTFTSAYTINNTVRFNLTGQTTGTTCGSPNGELELGVSGGTGPYIYSITGQPSFGPTGLSGYTFTNLPSGPYLATVTDNTGCIQQINLSVPLSHNVDFVLAGVNSTNGSNGSVTSFVTNGTPPFTLTWSPNVNSQTGYYVNNLSAGTYTLLIVDSEGCATQKSIDITGSNLLSSYQVYNICDGDFENSTTQIRKGPKEMLNEGYYDLTSGDTNCILNNAIFEAYVNVSGTVLTDVFYVSTALNDYPSDNEWYDVVTNLLLQIDGIGNVEINPTNNTIKILTDCNSTVNLSNAPVLVNLIIYYDISCVACNITPSPTPTLTPTPVNTLTPTSTPTLTPTVTPTPGLSPTQTPTNTPTTTPTNTVTPTVTPTPTVTQTPTNTPTETPTNTPTPTVTPTPGLSPSATPTITPTNTITPTVTPTITPTNTITPTITPSPSCVCGTPTITSITDAGGGNVNIYFTLPDCGGCVTTAIESSSDAITWVGPNNGGCTSPRVMSLIAGGDTYFRISQTGGCGTSDYSVAYLYNVPVPSPTASPTPTPTPPPCCTYYDVTIDMIDLGNATGNTDPSNDNVVYVSYDNCDGIGSTRRFTSSGTFTNEICVQYGSIPSIYYFTNDIQSTYVESYVSDTTNCCTEDPCDVYWKFYGGTTGTGGHTEFSYTDCDGTPQYIVVGNGVTVHYCGYLLPTPQVLGDGNGTFLDDGPCF